MKLLFVTWDGPGTVYHETLFVPLLTRAAQDGDHIGFLQFSWGSDSRRKRVQRLAQAAGADYELIRVNHGLAKVLLPLALLRGLWRVVRAIHAGHSDTIMARSMIPGGIALLALGITRGSTAFIYDADGLSADERVEYGGWPSGGVRYRLFRFLERQSIRRADVTLVRTRPAVDILTERTGVPPERFVILPNGKDTEAFHPGTCATRQSVRDSIGVPSGAPLLVHVGSAGSHYEPGFMIEVFRQVIERAASARLLILTPEMNHTRFRDLATDLHPVEVVIQEADPTDVPTLLAAADVGLAFRTPSYSQQAVAPIKVAEYLLCGLPVALRSGVGDLDSIVRPPVGMAVDGVTKDNATAIANWVVGEVLPHRSEFREAARDLGVEYFSLEAGAAAYRTAFACLKRAK